MTLRIRRRTRLRRRDVAHWAGRLSSEFGVAVLSEDSVVDEAEAGEFRLLILGHDPLALLVDDAVVPTVRCLLAHPASRRQVTVDMGAVPHVANGADVMAPGITEADPAIRAGDLVWVRDERNRRPLAVGRALVDGPAMPRGKKGKAVETLHHVGDALWSTDEEGA